IATHKLIEIDELLQGHAKRPCLIIFGYQLFQAVDPRNILPTAAIEWLHDRGQSRVINDRLPVERIFQVTQTLADNSDNVILLRQQDCLRNRDAQLARERVIEKLVVSGPPERIIDNDRSFQRQALERRAIKRHFVRDAIDYQIVKRRRVMANSAEGKVLSRDRSAATLVDVLNQCLGKSL